METIVSVFNILIIFIYELQSPNATITRALPSPRDSLPDGKQINELTLTYNVKFDESCEISVIVPVISDTLYDGDIFLWNEH